MSSLPVLGFIGIGRMGVPMTANLLRAGFTVHAYDILPERIDLVTDLGAIPAPSVAAVATEADIVISMIMDDTVLEAVALGEGGVIGAAIPGAIFADMSTVSPVASQKVAAAATAKGIEVSAGESIGQHQTGRGRDADDLRFRPQTSVRCLL